MKKKTHESPEKTLETKNIKYNHLNTEKSPYLLQHVNNPVDWYPWGDEAFRKSKKDNKPIFLSIGYSTCHWCHVMARESFQDPEIGKLMNQVFVPVKVDREERPDIDNVYMTVCQMMTGSGGWPLTIILTPDLLPFFAGTYFPKESGGRGVGLRDLILNVNDLWENKREDVLKSAEDITSSLEKISHEVSGDELTPENLKIAYEQLKINFDQKYAGFGEYQKFPTPHHLLFLLRYWKMTGEAEALEMVEKTLVKMRQGGIYDHVGFGFHRYSVDQQWLVPHFEKMLYDQALLVIAYTEAYQATRKLQYRETAEEIIEYVLRDMTSSEGGFYSAEDADSEGVEGKFYVWGEDEITDILGPEDGEIFNQAYNVKTEGNFTEEATGQKTGINILYMSESLKKLSLSRGLEENELWWKLEKSREKLLEVRKQRVYPHKDDKILTDWNGLMIAALSYAGQVFGNENYIIVAQNAAGFILNNLFIDGRLLHRWREEDAKVDGNMDDYSFFIWGLLELYEATFNIEYLTLSLELNRTLMEYFWDDENGGFYFTAKDMPEILVRKKESYDTAIPSGNSVALLNLIKLSLLTGNSELADLAMKQELAFSSNVKISPSAYTMFLSAVAFRIGLSFDVVIVGELGMDDTRAMLKLIRDNYLPNKVIFLKFKNMTRQSGYIKMKEEFKSLESKRELDGKVTAYVCGNGTCYPPVTSPTDLLNLLESNVIKK